MDAASDLRNQRASDFNEYRNQSLGRSAEASTQAALAGLEQQAAASAAFSQASKKQKDLKDKVKDAAVKKIVRTVLASQLGTILLIAVLIIVIILIVIFFAYHDVNDRSGGTIGGLCDVVGRDQCLNKIYDQLGTRYQDATK